MLNDDLTLKGTFAETTVADLFRSLVRSQETAVMTLDTEGRQDNIYVQEGRVIFATSSDPDSGLAEVLLTGGELSIEQYDAAIDQAGSRRLGAVLCDLGYLQPEELMRAVERQVVGIVTNSFVYRDGSYTIEFPDEFSKDIVALNLGTERLILDAIGTIASWSLVKRGVSRFSRVLQPAANADSRMYHIDLTDEESHIFSLFAQPESVETICQRSYLNNFRTCRTIWALLSANLLEDAESDTMDQQKEDVQSELDLEALVERYNGAMQAVFGVVFQEIGDHVYDFVDRVVLNLSPETTPYLSGVNLLNEGRVDFDQLLNNLIASGSADRTALVTQMLNELLYAWLFEVKREFGAKLDPQINPIVEGLRR